MDFFSSEMLSQVFISFRGKELLDNFISHLVGAFKQAEIKYDMNKNEVPREDPRVVCRKIEQSEVALVIFSAMYVESKWCLDELVKIVEQVKEKKLRIITVFFNVMPDEVKGEWKSALQSVPINIELSFANFRNDREFLVKIVDTVKRELAKSRGGREHFIGPVNGNSEHPKASRLDYGMTKRLEVKKELGSENVDTFSFQNHRAGGSLNIPDFPRAVYFTHDHGISTPPPPPPPPPPQYKVFLNFRGDEIRTNFLGFLKKAMRLEKINVFTDDMEQRGENLQTLFKRIKESRVAVAIFSERWIKTNKWEEALAAVSNNIGLTLDPKSDESKFVELIVEHVKSALIVTLNKERGNSTKPTTGEREEEPDTTPKFGVEQRLKQLEEKLKFGHEQTYFVGVVGMPGIGKTVLAKTLYDKWQNKFKRSMFFPDVGKMSKQHGLDWLQKTLMQTLLKDVHPNIGYKENAHEFWMDDLLNRKVFLVLDGISGKKQIEFLLGKRDWIKTGSKIVITSSDKSLLQDLVKDMYVVPRLNSRDSLLCFNNHAFGLDYAKGDFIKLSRNFLDYAKGNPLALKALGVELRGENEAYWKERIGTLTQSSSKMIQDVLRRRYDDLPWRQKDAFLDVACFFKSENEDFVRCMVSSCDYEFTKVRDEIRDLADKFLINLSCGRVEMHDLLCTFANELASQASAKSTRLQFRLLNHVDIIHFLNDKMEMKNVRGVFLDTSKVPEETSFEANIFSSMCSLLYLRVYSSAFLQEGKDDFKLSIPKELKLPLEEVRYLHWLKFPLEKLPSDFNPKKLVHLELPYSSIKQIWEGFKDTPKLKWVNLSYSRKLSNLSGLSNAQNLERLNLEGCRRLVNLPQEMEKMKSLIFLNMRGCRRVKSFPMIRPASLKILILSDCSRLQEFELISENLEALYLDGTALKELPPAVGDLERLSILNLKGCEMLESLPKCPKALEELILSGCSKLESIPKDVQNMRYLRILPLDGTNIKEMPMVYSLQRLHLSRNNAMIRLQGNISQLSHLKWLDLRNCENLRYLPTLPPNIEFFDAHGCERLEEVTNPLVLRMMTEQTRSTFFFTNCTNLKQDSRDVISSYAHWKCHRLALQCYDRGVVSGALFNICYPGFDVPSWFQHQAAGSVLEPSLQPRWCNNRLSGIALCAVVSFHDPTETFSVKCTLQIEKEDGSPIMLDFDIGSLKEAGKIESDHVFIGYASCSDLTKRLEDQYSIPTKAFLGFHVTDACKSEVVNCGMSFVYAEPQHVSVEANRDISSSKKGGGWMEDLLGYIFLAFFGVIIFAPHYYLRFLKFCWPLLALFLCLMAIGLFAEWTDGKPKQQKSSLTPGTGAQYRGTARV